MEVQGWDSFPWFVPAAPESVSLVTALQGVGWRLGLSVQKWMFFPTPSESGGGFTAQACSLAGFLATRQGGGWGAECVAPPRTPLRRSQFRCERVWSQEVCYLGIHGQCLCRVPVSQGFCRCSRYILTFQPFVYTKRESGRILPEKEVEKEIQQLMDVDSVYLQDWRGMEMRSC